MKLSQTVEGLEWLSQFRSDDQPSAALLLDRLLVVPTSEMRQWLGAALLNKASVASPVAIYAEREFDRGSRFFEHIQAGLVKRAIGRNGPPLIKTRRGSMHIGSEGILAQLITELVRRDNRRFIISPGPDRLRPMKSRGAIKKIAIVTDSIGSGDRIYKMLDALWKTETVRSWRSHRNENIRIFVFSYATTIFGMNRIKSHRLSPCVITAKISPAICDNYNDINLNQHMIVDICRRYDPVSHAESPGPLGHKGAGTLLAFAHGCPNTTPRIFWKNTRRWRALFPDRSAVHLEAAFQKASIIDFVDQLKSVRRNGLADPTILAHFSEEAKQALLVLAAVSRGIRGGPRLASRTGLRARPERVERLGHS